MEMKRTSGCDHGGTLKVLGIILGIVSGFLRLSLSLEVVQEHVVFV
jgi:hypothetical protein